MSILKIYRKLSRENFRCLVPADGLASYKHPSGPAYSTTLNIIRSPYNDVNLCHESLTEFVWKNLSKWGDKVAIQSEETGQAYTYSNLRELCARFARALKKRKFHKGQVLSIVLPNIPQYPIVLLGSIEAGLVVTTLNPNFSPAELSRQFADSETVVIVTLTSLKDHVQSAIKIIEEKTKREWPVVIITLEENPQFVSNFNQMLDEDRDEYDLKVNIQHDDVAFLPYSSGTTGFPKGVQLSHSNMMHNLQQLEEKCVKSVREAGGTFQEIVPAVVPFHHIYGISALILTSLINGCKIISMKKFEPEKYVNVIKNEKATVLYLVPSLMSFLNSCSLIKPNDLERVRIAFCGGSNTPINEMEKLISLSGNRMKMRHAYGLTEASPAVSVSTDIDSLGTVGQPLPCTCVKIVDADGSVLSSYQRGEICVQGPQVMKGYLNNAKATAEVLDADGFLHTGDVAYYNDEGKLFYIDRIKELIKVKGFQVAPVELESIIKAHNNVRDVGVIGVPDERCGEKPVAFVVAENCKLFRVEDLKRFVAQQVAPYKQLAKVILVESIPRNASGKILKAELKKNYAETC